MAIFAGEDPFWVAKRGTVTNGLVGHWDSMAMSAADRLGTRWLDISGNNNHGTLTNGASFDRVGCNFDGINDYSKLNTMSSINEFTWSAFVYPRSVGAGSAQGIFGSGGNDYDQVLWIANAYAGYTGFGIVSYNSGATNVASQQSLPTLNQWYHIIGVRNLNNNTLKLFINGSENTSVSLSSSTALYGSTQDWRIGSRGSGQFFNGLIEDVRVYSRALSASEILRNFNATRARFGV